MLNDFGTFMLLISVCSLKTYMYMYVCIYVSLIFAHNELNSFLSEIFGPL